MQGEDDLGSLAKIMAFMRAVSILLILMHFYWFCYSFFVERGWKLEIIDKILTDFDRTASLFSHILYTKIFAIILLALSCLGTRGVKNERITWPKIYITLVIGFILFFLNFPLLKLSLNASIVLYIFTTGIGYIVLMVGGLWMSRLLRNNLMDDVFNSENESFLQETRLMENEYSINLPTKFYYKNKWNNGWINIVNPFRATIVLGTPGSGKSYAIINNYIKQQIEKGFSMYIYDFKFDDLSTIAYNHLLKHTDKYKVKPKFYVINFDDPRRSHRCNPLNPEFMTDISYAVFCL
ncbi:MAG TPA: YWFCY domain-containing protein, partial [Ginsengibacter sp.]|nr:YWFCY domain-containing protein [Ginsengibacter sp.]